VRLTSGDPAERLRAHYGAAGFIAPERAAFHRRPAAPTDRAPRRGRPFASSVATLAGDVAGMPAKVVAPYLSVLLGAAKLQERTD